MKLLNFTIIKVTLYFITGIILGYYFHVDLSFSIIFSIVSILFLGILIWLTKSRLKNSLVVDVFILLATILVGILVVNLHDHKNFNSHYTKTYKTDSLYTFQFKVREVLKPSLYHDKYIVDLKEINQSKTSGKLLLNIDKESSNLKLSVDDIYITKTNLKPLNSPLNPYQFNYKKYLNRKHIYNQLSIKTHNLFKLKSTKNSLVGFASKLRETINKRLNKYGFNEDELAIINALLLGQRQDISKEIYESYTKAGAIHILAVSGLHVGIILLMLNHLFKPIEYLKQGKILKTVILVGLLWSYAFIAGLSPSVIRAVSMFTVFAIAMNLKRPTNVYNTIAISILFLLLFKPSLLFDVGFQMSYLAVLAIVTIEPMLNKLCKPKYKFISFFWKILTVTLAAQIGVLPISLYYFHQFPGLFFLSNLVILPFLGFILGFGILVIILALLKALPNAIAEFYGNIISMLNSFVNWVSLQENFLFQNISFGLIYVIVSYLLIISIIKMVKLKTYRSILIILVLLICVQGYFLYEKHYVSKTTFIIFHKSRKSIIGFHNDKKLQIYHNLNDSLLKNETRITNYKIGEGITTVKTDSLQNVYRIKSKTLLVIDSLGIYNVNTFSPNFILLRNAPKINLTRLIDSLQPDLIISDGSNYKSYQKRWKETCEAKKIPFHQTSEKGAFIYEY